MEEYWFLAPILRLAISSTSFIYLFFSKTLQDNLPVVRAMQLGRSMKKTASCKKAVTRLELLADWAPISGMEFDHFWNWFGKNKFPGALQHLK